MCVSRTHFFSWNSFSFTSNITFTYFLKRWQDAQRWFCILFTNHLFRRNDVLHIDMSSVTWTSQKIMTIDLIQQREELTRLQRIPNLLIAYMNSNVRYVEKKAFIGVSRQQSKWVNSYMEVNKVNCILT